MKTLLIALALIPLALSTAQAKQSFDFSPTRAITTRSALSGLVVEFHGHACRIGSLNKFRSGKRLGKEDSFVKDNYEECSDAVTAQVLQEQDKIPTGYVSSNEKQALLWVGVYYGGCFAAGAAAGYMIAEDLLPYDARVGTAAAVGTSNLANYYLAQRQAGAAAARGFIAAVAEEAEGAAGAALGRAAASRGSVMLSRLAICSGPVLGLGTLVGAGASFYKNRILPLAKILNEKKGDEKPAVHSIFSQGWCDNQPAHSCLPH